MASEFPHFPAWFYNSVPVIAAHRSQGGAARPDRVGAEGKEGQHPGKLGQCLQEGK